MRINIQYNDPPEEPKRIICYLRNKMSDAFCTALVYQCQRLLKKHKAGFTQHEHRQVSEGETGLTQYDFRQDPC